MFLIWGFQLKVLGFKNMPIAVEFIKLIWSFWFEDFTPFFYCFIVILHY